MQSELFHCEYDIVFSLCKLPTFGMMGIICFYFSVAVQAQRNTVFGAIIASISYLFNMMKFYF